MVGPSSSRPRTVASFTTPDPQRKGFKAFLFFIKKFLNVFATFELNLDLRNLICHDICPIAMLVLKKKNQT